jgi:glycosyltransferase involved in cell wall biosynthesis
MATEPLVSVIMPAYRAKAISSAAARSPLAQACAYWQAIIVSDDGGDDLAVLARAGIRDTMTEKGWVPWVKAELARLLEEPSRAA